jgi:ABC-type glutathione transport system ATPase component
MNSVISLQDVSVKYKFSGNVFRRRNYFDMLKSVNMDIYLGETLGSLNRNGAV